MATCEPSAITGSRADTVVGSAADATSGYGGPAKTGISTCSPRVAEPEEGKTSFPSKSIPCLRQSGATTTRLAERIGKQQVHLRTLIAGVAEEGGVDIAKVQATLVRGARRHMRAKWDGLSGAASGSAIKTFAPDLASGMSRTICTWLVAIGPPRGDYRR